MSRRKITFFDNYYDSDVYDEARKFLTDEQEEEPTEEQVYQYVADNEQFEWDNMLQELSPLLSSQVIVSGSMGRWYGTRTGASVESEYDLPKWSEGNLLRYILSEYGKDCDYFKISLEYGVICVRCSHHDGNNYFEIRNLSEKGRQAFSAWEYDEKLTKYSEADFMDKLVRSRVYTERMKMPEW